MFPNSPIVQSSTLDVIGNTPIVRLRKVVPPGSAAVFVKLEYFNPTGSYKDRMALAMIQEAEARGDLSPNMTVVEYTGGSTGSSLAFVCAVKGYRFKVVSSNAFSEEKLKTMRAFGAELVLVPAREDGYTADLFQRMIDQAREIASAEDVYWTDQFNNADALKGYEMMGQELMAQVTPIHAFCGSVGTAGMLMGVAKALRNAKSPARIVVLEPASSAVISTGVSGAHGVEGIGVGFLPPLLEEGIYNDVLAIDEKEAREMARRLAREEGIFAGISTGLNVVGALHLAQELGPDHNVSTVAVDTGLKYLSGELFEV
jgi:cysteine synthase A